jgi:hypothetical protein
MMAEGGKSALVKSYVPENPKGRGQLSIISQFSRGVLLY